jgi:hypothetical protein
MKYTHAMLFALAMTAALTTGCLLEGDEDGPGADATRAQALDLVSDSGSCQYAGTRTCWDADGNVTSIDEDFHLAIPVPDGGCPETHDYQEVDGFGANEHVRCAGILPQTDDGEEPPRPTKHRASRIDLNP